MRWVPKNVIPVVRDATSQEAPVAEPTPHMGMQMDPDLDQALELEMRLERVCAYALALEERCNRLWSYIPGNAGVIDPSLAYLAVEHGVTDEDLGRTG